VGDLLREIDEELRQERFERLWQSYGKYAMGVGVVLVLAVVGWKSWDHYSVSQKQAQSMQFSTANQLLAEGKKAEAASLFANLADSAGGGYGTLARFHQAALRAEAGDTVGALAVYDELSKDTGLDPTMREAAVIFSVMLRLDDAATDVAKLMTSLTPLMSDGGAWRHAARELAGLIALRQSDTKLAREHFQKVADDPAAPQGIRSRAVQILAVIPK
jgi:hypothetical protein